MPHRRDRFKRIGRRLESLSDEALVDLLGRGLALGAGIGGTRTLVTVDGDPVFAKRVPLTNLEKQPENIGSTANLFDLPLGCQYGVGSPSFGVWREVAAAATATSWVTSGSSRSFPVLFHWRILPIPAFDGPLPDELEDVEALVAHWHDSAAVRHRADAIAESTATVALFFEYIPTLLPDLLAERHDAGILTDSSIEATGRELLDAVDLMNSAGLWHFDTHFGNILADNDGAYVTDFGLAASSRFDLTPSERAFLAANRTHDIAYTATRLVNWIVTEIGGVDDREQRDGAIRHIADGEPADRVISGPGSTFVARFAPIAASINRFYERLHGEDRRTGYPADEIEALWASVSFG